MNPPINSTHTTRTIIRTRHHPRPPNTRCTEDTSVDLVDENLSLADMLRMNAHLMQLEDAERQKSSWDNRTPATMFDIGDIVQWYNDSLDGTYRSDNKIKPRWSMPHIITGKSLNSYTLATLYGTEIPGSFHSRRLRRYIPLRGSNLDLSNSTPDPTQPNNQRQEDIDEAEERMAYTE